MKVYPFIHLTLESQLSIYLQLSRVRIHVTEPARVND